MFNAVVQIPYEKSATLTKGRTYQVIDVNEFYGTYTIINDLGEIANVDWMRFADMGKAYDAYKA